MAEHAKYKVKYDYHTHTSYSHGKGTIAENVRAAASRGLTGVAISDHGPGHLFYGIDTNKIRSMRDEIEELRLLYKDMDIFLSVEANIINSDKYLDIGEGDFKNYDFVIAGYHYGAGKTDSIRNFIHHYCPIGLPGRNKLKLKNTDMAVRAIYENKIAVLTHPGDKGPFDIEEVAKACAARGTLLEINENHRGVTLEAIKQASKTDVKFIVCSDAHSPEKVGICDDGIKKAIQAGLDLDRIVNIVKS